MRKINLLDCTLRDGGYINDWRFGAKTIQGFCRKMAQTGVEMLEVGFIKGDVYNPDRSVFPDIQSISAAIRPKSPDMLYVGMLDMSAPIPLERLVPCDGSSLDAIRVIFKKDKTEEAYAYCRRVKELGYRLFVNFVGTDLYTDAEFIAGVEKFNDLDPYAMSIVDTFGLIKRKQFLRLVYLADNNMKPGIALCYHAHNNLQQALGNAEALVEMNLNRDLCIDACVFGMGRGAGNLNLEVFAEYMNDNYETHYRIEPMLEIMDEYLNEIYQNRFWGYSLPLYLSASTGCHPNYAVYLAEKDTLTVKAFNELLQMIPPEDKARFSKEKAEHYYRAYQARSIDDKKALTELADAIRGKAVLLLAPGRSLIDCRKLIQKTIEETSPVIFAVNFNGGAFRPDYIFSSNMRRFSKIPLDGGVKTITTSNMEARDRSDYVVNFSSYISRQDDVIDNSGLMALRLLAAMGAGEVLIAGMDGYSEHGTSDYIDRSLEYTFESGAAKRNRMIAAELADIRKQISLRFITPTHYFANQE